MDWIWWALGIVFVMGWLAFTRHYAYRHGVWDGAFNQGLPHVQEIMRGYDPERTAELMTRRQAWLDDPSRNPRP
ncbi:hypothetical protein [Roseomonas chloroacetimidivorans]|uniref:hypothetical protein n=1 Tax=Roseomonas chloroacetimidivorans TaxID=1766656 RepID=UPI003C75292C